MIEICSHQGLDDSWCRQQLDDGAACVLALDGDQPVGVGLVTAQSFWIEEILHTIHPAPGGCYLFATYVSPAHRGQGIQRQLDHTRLAWAAAQGLHYAYSIVESTNLPSLRSHRSSGFRPAARITRLLLPRLSLFTIRRTSPSLPLPELTHDGFPATLPLHLILNAHPA